ncbi:hypothetical protein IWW47_000490 [Coemansia sp. RSA 2052]|nr:hypothetical protein IWW47_000490 [Coemansia sp. RSA 2052]
MSSAYITTADSKEEYLDAKFKPTAVIIYTKYAVKGVIEYLDISFETAKTTATIVNPDLEYVKEHCNVHEIPDDEIYVVYFKDGVVADMPKALATELSDCNEDFGDEFTLITPTIEENKAKYQSFMDRYGDKL